MQHSQDHDIEQLKRQIEQQLNWGPPGQWTGKDFDTLSEDIQRRTGQAISVTTLKRLWGRVQAKNPPSTSTLDILSQFADFEHWRGFKQSVRTRIDPSHSSSHQKKRLQRTVLGLVLMGVIIGLWQGYAYFTDRSALTSGDVDLQVHMPTAGLPSSVRIDYDLKAGQASDVQLLSEGSAQEQVKLSQSKGSASFTYFSILANDQRILHSRIEQSLGAVGGVSIVLSGIGEIRHTGFLP